MLSLWRLRIAVALVACAILATAGWPRPAEAGIGACLDTLAAPAKAAELASTLADPTLLACTGQAGAGDPVQIALLAVVTALAIDGQFETAGQCSYIANKAGAALLKELASQSNAFKSAIVTLVGKDGFDQLMSEGADAAIGQLKQIPAIAALFAKFDCACLVAGTALEAKKVMEKVLKDTAACAGFVGAAGGKVIDQFGVAGGKIHKLLHPNAPGVCTTGSGGYIKEYAAAQTCPAGSFKVSGAPRFLYQWPSEGFLSAGSATYDACPPEWLDECGLCDMSKKPKGFDSKSYPGMSFLAPVSGGSCYCPPPAKILYDGALSIAVCVCPAAAVWDGKGCAACPAGTVKSNGQCADCGKGGVFDAAAGACKPKCKPGEIVGPNGACTTCPAGSAPSLTKSLPNQPAVMSSEGTCTPCPTGLTAKPGDTGCGPVCPPGQEMKNGACFPVCPAGQVAVQTGEFKTTCKACPKGTWQQGNSCTACPKGATWEATAMGGACTCPPGQTNREGVCYACQGVVTAGPDGGSCTRCFEIGARWNKDTGACEACPRGTTFQMGQCLPAGGVSPAPYTPQGPPVLAPGALDVIPCPPGQTKSNGQCIVPQGGGGTGGTLAPTRGAAPCAPGTIRNRAGECITCPAGQVPDARGMACEAARTPSRVPIVPLVTPPPPREAPTGERGRGG